MERIRQLLKFADDNKLYPDLRIIEGGADPVVKIDGREVLMFSSNNYLGLTSHPAIKEAAKKAIDKYGTGSGGSRLLSGNLDIHLQAEEAIARFKGGEAAIIYPCGYSANIGVVSAVADVMKTSAASVFSKKTVIISDELNHASIIDGCKLSRQEVVVYRHNDAIDLEKQLKKYKSRRILVTTDGVFSMDGDIAPLDKIVALKNKYDFLLMIDEAHATGMLGDHGHGTPDYFNLDPKKIDIIMGTFSKALGAQGGYVVGSEELIRYLRITSRSYMFSTAMTPSTAGTIIAALAVLESDSSIRESMWDNAKYLKSGLQKIGFNTLTSETQIIPILIGKDETAIAFSRQAFEAGIFSPCVRWPAVEKGKARIRVTVMATHEKKHLDKLLGSFEEIGKKLKII